MELSPEDTRARAFAVERHGIQKYGQHPYVYHLERVRRVLADFGYGDALGIAAWLHDVVEDTETTRDEITAAFGEEVSALVWAVTGVGKTRADRNASMFEKVRAYPAAANLKLADRIANMEASFALPDKRGMYREELPIFTEHLAGLGDERLWARLRKAALREPG